MTLLKDTPAATTSSFGVKPWLLISLLKTWLIHVRIAECAFLCRLWLFQLLKKVFLVYFETVNLFVHQGRHKHSRNPPPHCIFRGVDLWSLPSLPPFRLHRLSPRDRFLRLTAWEASESKQNPRPDYCFNVTTEWQENVTGIQDGGGGGRRSHMHTFTLGACLRLTGTLQQNTVCISVGL